MAANNGNQDLIQIFDSNNENSLLVTENNGTQQSRQRIENNDKKSICWKYFDPFKVPKRGETTKCTIDGCNAKYIWRGSTSNLVRHLRDKHGITSTTVIQPSLTNNNLKNFELEVNLPVIKFIVSSVLPFNIVDNLKSSGLVNQQITSSIIEKQIDKVYDRLFSQLKSKVQQAKSVMISISLIYGDDIMITYDWLTDDFEFRKILLHINNLDDFTNKIYDGGIDKVLDKWELINLKFISYSPNDLYLLPGNMSVLKGKNEDIIICENGGRDSYLIINSLKKWAKENNYTQEMSNIITAIINVLDGDFWSVKNFLRDIRVQRIMNNDQIAEKISCDCHYHKIEFLALIEQPFKMLINDHSNSNDNFIKENVSKFRSLLLDKIPFSIFPELLRLFKPLDHFGVVTMKNLRDMLINAFDILNETSQCVIAYRYVMSYQQYLELETLKSFLTFLINSHPNLTKGQELANGELEHYNKLPQVLINEDDPCKWWQKSKHLYPGLATLAIKYLPLLKLNDKEASLESQTNFKTAYDDDYETINKIAFLQYNIYNMKYIDL
ncbi:zinc finger bed domain-containing protein 4-like [Gigaspora margarita]|uniref:Zinc finger bed domain-containing protein 4-like n=1 Tax=Gigaspora margarita TaxID=4874 RepID=A0A8H4AJX8_GIGMA|nr:zinc finger bed domain-containing protein 4-like [Gigaspora margarita]